MAIAGLHNVPVIESSILRESQSSSSGRVGIQGSIGTRASSIRQMWLELEDECVVNRVRERGRARLQQERNDALSNCQEGEGRGGLEDSSESENGSVINSESLTGPLNEQDDRQSMTSEQSQDFGLVERARVRRIFQEWKNNGGAAQAPNVPHRNRGSRSQWLGEGERERVRVVREWIQMTSQPREDQVSEAGSQIEQVRDGQVVDHNEGQVENIRRPIRRLCGRQALLDLLAKKEQERRQELQGLEVTCPVSRFAHRNRIQSLLRIRCFQNMRSAESRRPSSTAESELGLLRQRQTVSGLRGGFLSRLDSFQVQASDLSGSSLENSPHSFRDDQTQANSTNEGIDSTHVPNDPQIEVLDGAQVQNEFANEILDDAQQNESANEILAGTYEQSDVEGNAGVGPSADVNQSREGSGHINLQQLEVQAEMTLELASDAENRSETVTSGLAVGSSDEGYLLMNSQEPSRSGSVEEAHEISHHFNTHREDINLLSELDDEVHVSEEVNGQNSSIQVEDWPEHVTMYDESRWQGSVLSNQWRDDDQREIDRQHWPVDGAERSHGALESEVREQNDAQEDYWHESGSQETPRDWLGMPSSGVTSGRLDTYYFSDDDNVHHMELRELVNRRRVSSLLHSDFRESLDQLIQSYVERQTNAPDDWELHEMSPPFTMQNQDHLSTDHSEESGPIHAEEAQRVLPRPPPLPQANWGHNGNWSRRESQQHPGTEWEIINDLRIDMARLQQRLNNMQRMLEACMDMQLELQRSVRQEVSAALNRSANPSELLENVLPKDSFKWDCVRKGVCCICSNTNIDSLLYRCGHMCTCTKCADLLVQGDGKCPMCQAPVIEVIRAYFIQ
ncbi:uncharacterized protein LOC110696831 [Chenopodium quinoa]|uniref:uncharacterized protein LOC110696831 n=1 Tax=Chenopodium quinoa TaxID=63459 RepID=UPI000B786EA9|nr:uncharacterized protein LOC110696831 [Chenopodium quinoa]XP_021729857.1 uncharacterized protein LOC110696831 [Chenopodium quinoa]